MQTKLPICIWRSSLPTTPLVFIVVFIMPSNFVSCAASFSLKVKNATYDLCVTVYSGSQGEANRDPCFAKLTVSLFHYAFCVVDNNSHMPIQFDQKRNAYSVCHLNQLILFPFSVQWFIETIKFYFLNDVKVKLVCSGVAYNDTRRCRAHFLERLLKAKRG